MSLLNAYHMEAGEIMRRFWMAMMAVAVLTAGALMLPGEGLAAKKDCFSVLKSDWKICDEANKKQGLVLMLKNICVETMQLQACIEKEGGEWDCQWFRDIKKESELEVSSCDNTGSYKLNACEDIRDCEEKPK